MFDTVLCCTDFSANSYSAFLQAARIAEEEGARLYVLHVVPPVPQVVRLGIRDIRKFSGGASQGSQN